jgi:hypothetical protein
MQPVLFLDMDGVVADASNAPPLTRLRPACVRRLDTLVHDLGARVVISSTWRETTPPAALRSYLAHHGYRGDVDSVTPILKGHTRGEEIRMWLSAHGAWSAPFVILDDWPLAEFAGLHDRLVSTEYDAGLTDADCERAVRLVAEQRRPVVRHVPATRRAA